MLNYEYICEVEKTINYTFRLFILQNLLNFLVTNKISFQGPFMTPVFTPNWKKVEALLVHPMGAKLVSQVSMGSEGK